MGRTEHIGDEASPLSIVPPDDQRQARALGETLVELQQKERSRIAFDLHDGPAQSIATALLQVRMIKSADPEEMRAGLEETELHLLTALDELYGSMERLRSKAMDREDLVGKLQGLSVEFAARNGIDVSFTCEGCEGDLSRSLHIALFQIVQEALNNIGRHAQATTVAVSVRVTDDLAQVTIQDDGKGFDPGGDEEAEHGGYGLVGMRERARLLGGECVVESGPDGGCRVEARIPVWRG